MNQTLSLSSSLFPLSLLLGNEHSGGTNNIEKQDLKYTWNFSDIFKSDENWQEVFDLVEAKLPVYENYVGKLGLSVQSFAQCLQFDEELSIKIEQLHLYAMLRKDSDLRENKHRAMYDKIISLYSRAAAAGSFIKPELSALPKGTIDKYLADDNLTYLSHFFENISRTKTHTLDTKEEALLAMAGEIASLPYDTFSVFSNADIKFPIILNEKGEKEELSHGKYSASLYSENRKYREKVYRNYYKFYIDYANTLSVVLSGNLKSNIFFSKARKYASAKEAALDRNNIPVSVYDNLIKTASENLQPLHRWAEIKKKVLKVKNIQPFDSYIILFGDKKEKSYEFEEARELVTNSLKFMGEDYLQNLKIAFDNRWIDVYENKGKRSGAYSSGVTYGVHPYVLMNWNNTLNDVFTLTHEMGHNMHSFYSGKNQKYRYAEYTIFVAEVASTFNESFLLDYLVENAESNEVKISLIEKYLNNVTATFYRQTMFAEFEQQIYHLAETGNSLTSDGLRKLFSEVYSRYWGPAMKVPREEEFTWARIPHFYYNFYVYQYATGFAASEALNANVRNIGQPAIDKYLYFLKSGSSKYSIDLLKDAGVDLTSPEPVLATINKMTFMLDKLESMI